MDCGAILVDKCYWSVRRCNLCGFRGVMKLYDIVGTSENDYPGCEFGYERLQRMLTFGDHLPLPRVIATTLLWFANELSVLQCLLQSWGPT